MLNEKDPQKIVELPKVPDSVRDYILHAPFVPRSIKTNDFISFIFNENGVMTERIYAYRSNGSDLQIIEIMHRDEKDLKNCYARQTSRSMMGGWYCYWPGEKAVNYGSQCFADEDGFEMSFDFEQYDRKMHFWCHYAWSIEDVKFLDPTLKYLPLCYDDMGDITKVVGLYRKKPLAIELFRKGGYWELTKDSRFNRLSDKTIKSLATFVRSHPFDVSEENGYQRYTLSAALFLMKNPDFTFDDYCHGWITPEERDTGRYLKKQRESNYTYNDYLELCEEMKVDLSKKENIYPDNLRNAHDALCTLKKVKEHKKDERKLAKVASKFSKANANVNGYDFVIPSKIDDIAHQANELIQCLIKCEYDRKMANGEELLVLIKKGDKPIATAELLKTKDGYTKLGQFYKKHDKNPDKETKTAFNHWFKNVYKPSLAAAV